MKMLLLLYILQKDGTVEVQNHTVYGVNVCEMYRAKAARYYGKRLVLGVCFNDDK